MIKSFSRFSKVTPRCQMSTHFGVTGTHKLPQMSSVLTTKPEVSQQQTKLMPDMNIVVSSMKMKATEMNYNMLSDSVLVEMLFDKQVQQHKLEEILEDKARAVRLRRMFLAYRVTSSQKQNEFSDI